MKIRKHIKDFIPEMNKWRHHIHANPEIAYEEHNTSDFIATKLNEFNIEVHRGSSWNWNSGYYLWQR